MTHGNWRVLADGPRHRALLTVDFGPGRPQASFADLVTRMPPGPLVWESVFAPARDVALDTDPDRLVERWVAGLRVAGLTVHGVLGYCAGAALACRTADALRRAGHGEPVVVLLDPIGVDGGLIYDLFASSVRQYAHLLPERACRAALDTVAAATEGLGADIALAPMPALATAIRGVQAAYDAVVGTVCELLGAGNQAARGFSDRFASFLSYQLTAGRAMASLREHVRSTVYVSGDHQPPHPFHRIDQRFPVSRVDLLADPAVAEAVTQAVWGIAPPRG